MNQETPTDKHKRAVWSPGLYSQPQSDSQSDQPTTAPLLQLWAATGAPRQRHMFSCQA